MNATENKDKPNNKPQQSSQDLKRKAKSAKTRTIVLGVVTAALFVGSILCFAFGGPAILAPILNVAKIGALIGSVVSLIDAFHKGSQAKTAEIAEQTSKNINQVGKESNEKTTGLCAEKPRAQSNDIEKNTASKREVMNLDTINKAKEKDGLSF